MESGLTYDTSDGGNGHVWQESVELFTRAARSLDRNPAFLPENISRQGSVWLAGAMAVELPMLAEQPVHEYTGRIDSADSEQVYWLFVDPVGIRV